LIVVYFTIWSSLPAQSVQSISEMIRAEQKVNFVRNRSQQDESFGVLMRLDCSMGSGQLRSAQVRHDNVSAVRHSGRLPVEQSSLYIPFLRRRWRTRAHCFHRLRPLLSRRRRIAPGRVRSSFLCCQSPRLLSFFPRLRADLSRWRFGVVVARWSRSN